MTGAHGMYPDSPPLRYQRVKRMIIDKVRRGEWPVGHMIPSERELCLAMGVSRATVLRALSDLVHQGLLERRQGLGTFVTGPAVVHGPVHLRSFTEEMADRGHAASARVLECEERKPPPEAAEALGLAPDQRVVFLRRVRFGEDAAPMGLQESFLPVSLVPGLADQGDRLKGSLYRLLAEDYGVRPARAVETVRPARFGAAERELLQCGGGVLAFRVERVTYGRDGRAIEFVRSMMRGDRYEYVLELVRSEREPF